MALATGTRLGPYEIGTPLGADGMGEVSRARDTRLDRTFAIKILPAGMAGDPEFRERFEREAGILHRDLKPANIKITREGSVKVLDLGLGQGLEFGGVDVGRQPGAGSRI